MILYSTGDLMWASRLRVAGESCGVPVKPARRDSIEAQLETTEASGLLVELDGDDAPFELIRRARAARAGLGIVAFGPHVSPALLAQASDAGADEVLTRGALTGSAEAVLTRLAARGPAPG